MFTGEDTLTQAEELWRDVEGWAERAGRFGAMFSVAFL